jgi:hypothetical protein
VSSSVPMLLPRACPGCQDSAPLAVTASGGTFYLGWICARCLAVDAKDGLLDIIGVHATSEDAEMDLLTEKYWASLQRRTPIRLLFRG